ncbi:protease inhibitor I42 family protein [Streptomyces sp. NPDC002886]|uniref:protease inhibitor I42 family protein n=1 Tax=Streptomyces sp. NPDC002886 TaxID=3364667 RepID=UPI0036803E9A
MEVREVELAPGEPYEVRLTGRGARGYVWTWRVTGDADAVSVAESPVDPVDPVDPGRPLLPGATVERLYVVRGRVAGRARIRFAQVRPPYPEEAAFDEFVLDVTVL